jgi:hypothetical protein
MMLSEDKFSEVLVVCDEDRSTISKHTFHNEFTATIERDGKWHTGYCPEIPRAIGQGESIEECKRNLADAISLT